MPDPDDETLHTAGDVRRVTGMSYRQLNDWDERGALPTKPDRDANWRRFTPSQVFVVLVSAELRKRFGVPVERLKFVQEMMLQPGADHFRASVRLMLLLEVEVWLMTDFEKTFIVDSELEFTDLWAHGFFGAGLDSAAFLRLSPLVNRVLSARKEPFQISTEGRRGAALFHAATAANATQTNEEREILQLIRSGDFAKIEVVLRDGNVDRIRTTTHPDVESHIAELLKQHDFQTLQITTRDGQVVSIEQQAVKKP